MVVVEKNSMILQVLFFFSTTIKSGDNRIEDKENEKIEKYQDLAKKLQKISNVRVLVI